MSNSEAEDIARLEVENQRLLESNIEKNREVDRMLRALTLMLIPINVLHETMQATHVFSQPFQRMVDIAWEEGRQCLNIQ